MLPKLRSKLGPVSSKNQSLQDILSTCGIGTEVLEVNVFKSQLHNTAIIVKLEGGEKRVQFYNRLDLSDILGNVENLPIEEGLSACILFLNTEYDCDFTEDDLELLPGVLKATSTSLGYIGEIPVPVLEVRGWGYNFGNDYGAVS